MARRRGNFGGQPATQRPADDANALQPLRFQKPGIEADEVEDRVEPGGTLRAVEARMGRQIHRKMLGQGLGVAVPAQTALSAVEDQQWRTGPDLEESDLRTAYVHERFMHAGRHSLLLLRDMSAGGRLYGVFWKGSVSSSSVPISRRAGRTSWPISSRQRMVSLWL